MKHLLVIAFAATVICWTAFGGEEQNIPELFEISFAFESQGNYSAALNSVMLIVNKNPKNYTAHLRVGWLYYLEGMYKESVAFYKKAETLAPAAIEPLEGELLPLMAMKDWAGAEKTALEIRKTDPGNYRANSRLAYILFSQARYSDAAKMYEEVLKRYPSDLDMKLGLGWTYLRMGNKKKAAEFFLDVLEVRRNNQNALSGMEEITRMK